MSAEAVLRVAILFALATSAPATATAWERVNLYAADGARAGHAIVNRETGRGDFFDPRARGTGYGTVDLSTGRAERFGPDGKRQAPVILPGAPRGRGSR